MSLLDHMKLADPAYGTQAHQRDFIVRMGRAQSLNPCGKDHVHVTACYPVHANGRMVGS